MKLNITSERDNPHMKRKEVMLGIEHEGESTPRRDALLQMAAKQFGYDEQKTDVRNIFSDSGAAKSNAKIFVWTEKKPEAKVKAKKEAKKAEPKKS